MHKSSLGSRVFLGLAAMAFGLWLLPFSFASHAQTPDGSTPDESTNNQTPADRCAVENCEPQRQKCVNEAQGDSERLAACEGQVHACLDACKNGNYTYQFVPPPPACTENSWACGTWSDCSADGGQTRACTRQEDCAGGTSKPAEAQMCTPSPPPEVDSSDLNIDECERDLWTCKPWSACSPQGRRTRVCTLDLDCPNAQDPSPHISEACTPPPPPVPTDAQEPAGETAVVPPAPEEPPTLSEKAAELVRALVEDFEKNTENVSGGFGLVRPLGSPNFSTSPVTRCEDAGLPAARCRDLLKDGLGFEDCAVLGIMSKESCGDSLTRMNEGVFPGCEGLPDEQCAAVMELRLIEYLPKATTDDLNILLEIALTEQLTPQAVLGKLFPGIGPDVGWWRSAPSGAGENSVGVLVRDSDGDKLPDDFEKTHGLDYLDPDSDDDGVNDTDEMKAMTDLDPTETTIVFRRPLEQPRGAGEVDASFTIQVPYSGQLAEDSELVDGAKITDVRVQDSDASAGNLVRATGSENLGNNENWDFGGRRVITGHCDPDATCLIYLYSYIPMVLAVKTDADGNFTYDISKSLTDGSHVAYVAVTDDQGKVTKKSGPLSFFIKEAQAVSEEDFVAADADTIQAVQSYARLYVLGALVLVVLALGLVWQAARTVKKGK